MAEILVDVWRGDYLESRHFGSWVVVNRAGEIVDGAGDSAAEILPRSSLKPIQALTTVDSGAAKAFGLSPKQLALSCASHSGEPFHASTVTRWLDDLGLSEDDLRCGVEPPKNANDRQTMRDENRRANQTHNNCSGKHSGFLTLSRHLNAGPEYLEPDHPVQRAVREAVEDMTGEATSGFAIDGCSAPNYATTLGGLARAMARIASAQEDATNIRDRSAFQLRSAMATHPEYVAGTGRSCTRLMRAMDNGTVVKTGAEAVYVAAIPGLELGVALKIADGSERASEVAIAAILARLGALDANSPEAKLLLRPEISNWRGIVTGYVQPSEALSLN